MSDYDRIAERLKVAISNLERNVKDNEDATDQCIVACAVSYGGYLLTDIDMWGPLMYLQQDGIGKENLERFAEENGGYKVGFVDQYGKFYSDRDAVGIPSSIIA